jgi:hypothetical protein
MHLLYIPNTFSHTHAAARSDAFEQLLLCKVQPHKSRCSTPGKLPGRTVSRTLYTLQASQKVGDLKEKEVAAQHRQQKKGCTLRRATAQAAKPATDAMG